jgi:drug/metabolite transporter (DMT)-like permease
MTTNATARPAPRTRTDLLPLAAIGVTVVLWASAFVAIRHVIAQVSAGPMALGRLLVGAVALGLIVLLRPRRRQTAPTPAAPTPGAPALGWPTRQAWPRLLVVGIVWFGIYNVALNAAERRVDAGTAAMLVNVGPILIAVLAGLFLGEGFPRRLIAGLVVAFAGAVLIGIATSTGGGADLWGVVLCLVAAVAYAVGVVTQKPLLATASGLHVTLVVTVIGAVACLPFAPALVDEIRAAEPSTMAWLVYLGVGPTALGFLTWAYALARSSAGRLGAATYLVPPVVVGLAWLLLDERPATLALVGGLVCLAGVYVARRRA